MSLPNTNIDKLDPFFRYAHKGLRDVITTVVTSELSEYVKKDSVTSSFNVSEPGYYIADASSLGSLKREIEEVIIILRNDISAIKDLIETSCLSLNGHSYGSNPLPYGTDLNSYTYIHQATVPYDNVQYVEHCPTTMGFRFFVLNMGAPVSDYDTLLQKCIQVVMELGDAGLIYIRGYYGAKWTNWITLKSTSNILSGTGPLVGHPGDIYFKYE